MDNRQKIGKLIRQKRLLLDMTQQELAEKLGYKARVSINRIENGVVSVPKEKLEQFALALNCSVEELQGGTSNINKENITYVNDNINIEYPKLIEYKKTNDNNFNEISYKLWSKYNEDYESYINDINVLRKKLYITSNKIGTTNQDYECIFNDLNKLYNSGELNGIINTIVINAKNDGVEDITTLKNTLKEDIAELLYNTKDIENVINELTKKYGKYGIK